MRLISTPSTLRGSRATSLWLYREEQLEIFAAMQRELKRIERAAAAQFRHSFVDRQQRRIDQRAHTTRRAHRRLRSDERPSLRSIIACGETFLAQHDSPADARFRPKLAQQYVIEFLRIFVAEILFGKMRAAFDQSQTCGSGAE